jgi:hypothetical protein
LNIKFFKSSKFLIVGLTLLMGGLFLLNPAKALAKENDVRRDIILSPVFSEINLKNDIKAYEISLNNKTSAEYLIQTEIRKYWIKDGRFIEVPKDDVEVPAFSLKAEQFNLAAESEAKTEVVFDKSKIAKDYYEFWGIVFKVFPKEEDSLSEFTLLGEMVSIVAVRGEDVEDLIAVEVLPQKPFFPVVFIMPPAQSVTVKNIGETVYVYRGQASLVRGTGEVRGITLENVLLNTDGELLLPDEKDTYKLSWDKYSQLPFLQQIGFYSVRSNVKYATAMREVLQNYEFFYVPIGILIVVVLLIALIVFIILRRGRILSIKARS